MTAQVPDILLLRGQRHELCTTPLDDYLKRLPKNRRPKFCAPHTALWRGYVATWEIRDGKLWLTAIRGDLMRGQEVVDASLPLAFPRWTEPVHATWFSGELRCPEGALMCYRHAGFGSSYERDRMIEVVRGMVRREELHINPPSPVIYRIEPDGTRIFDNDINNFTHIDSDLYLPDEVPRGARFWQAEAEDIARQPPEEGIFIGGYTTLG